ncbi:MAG: hypothetical protein DRR42_19685 [Gammaproteobacteria bacterium]|nr:MAG: hypothetical protein DRR42_19685 [Gammaproteobacteria bacterium]
MSGGRPTVYNEELLAAVKDYIENYADHGHAMPSVVGLCMVINRSKTTIYRWKEEEGKESFRDILNKLIEKQELVLFNGGLSSEFNAAITKLALGKHGYHDKLDNTQAAPDGGPIAHDHTWTVKVVKPDA